jgi:hypothetical protein
MRSSSRRFALKRRSTANDCCKPSRTAGCRDSFTRPVTLGVHLGEQARACRSVVLRLGVKGSQVQILSSRRPERSPLTWMKTRSEGFFVFAERSCARSPCPATGDHVGTRPPIGFGTVSVGLSGVLSSETQADTSSSMPPNMSRNPLTNMPPPARRGQVLHPSGRGRGLRAFADSE